MILLSIAILIFAWGASLLATPGSDGFKPRGTFGIAFVLLGTALGVAALLSWWRHRLVRPS
jgi:hypothetical protein